MDDLIAGGRIAEGFPFFSYSGTPFFQLSNEEVDRLVQLVFRIDDELQVYRPDREKAVRLYLYLFLLELKRCYDAMDSGLGQHMREGNMLVTRFRQLVNQYYLEKQRVADYAAMLCVTPNYLSRFVREVTGRTASSMIDEMLLQEAKVLLRSTDLSLSEVSDHLSFSEPSAFSRFFKKAAGTTPLAFRSKI